MPRLIRPSNGGGTKLMRTLLTGESEGVWFGVGNGVADSLGKAENTGEAASIGVAVGVGDSCAKTAEAANPIAVKMLAFAVISPSVETLPFDVVKYEKTARDSATLFSMTTRRDVVTPVYIWEQIIAQLALAKKFFVHIVGDKLVA